jgi:FAD/FMN-containing dehydrogenase
MDFHRQKLADIIEQLEQRRETGESVAWRKGSVPHIVPDPKDPRFKKPKIDLRGLNEIISIDESERTCTAESGVTFSDLVQATLPKGLIPLTVPELKGITVGGAVTGCSIESMSYRYGGFHDSCLEYEVLSSTGEVLVCTEKENSEIFQMIHGSYGTLGILTKLMFRLIPAKPYVKMVYVTARTVDEYRDFLLERCVRDDYDFVDGIIHRPDRFVACLGKMVDEAPYTSSYKRANIFYRSTARLEEDFLETYDYFFRYDTDCHWLTSTIPLLEWKPIRILFGGLYLGSTNLIRLSKLLRHFLGLKRRPDVVVDVFIPSYNFAEFYRWYEREIDFFPLWIVPYRMREIYPWISKEYKKKIGEESFFIDCAIYGKQNNSPDMDYSRLLERKVYELSGVKTLISRNHYDEKTFWSIYNQSLYSKVKARVDPINLFGDLYTKLHPHRDL